MSAPFDRLVTRVATLEALRQQRASEALPAPRHDDRSLRRAIERTAVVTIEVPLALYESADAEHVAAADPHTQYALERRPIAVYTTNQTLVAATVAVFDTTTGGALAATLPASPVDGDHCIVKRSGVSLLTVGRNGKLIDNEALDYTLDDGVALEFRYDSASGSWWVF